MKNLHTLKKNERNKSNLNNLKSKNYNLEIKKR